VTSFEEYMKKRAAEAGGKVLQQLGWLQWFAAILPTTLPCFLLFFTQRFVQMPRLHRCLFRNVVSCVRIHTGRCDAPTKASTKQLSFRPVLVPSPCLCLTCFLSSTLPLTFLTFLTFLTLSQSQILRSKSEATLLQGLLPGY
jgi:hypothetical protein